MAYPRYLREKARTLRAEKQLTLDEIADRLALSRTTVYYWIEDMPRPLRALTRPGPAHRLGSRAMQKKYKLIRDEWHELGRWEFPRLAQQPTFRDFVCLYIAEGYKRNRNSVSIGNSDPAVVRLAADWIRQFSSRSLDCGLQFHADQNPRALSEFWAAELGVTAESVRLQRKSNSSQLRQRNWRSEYGVLTVRVSDTALRARLQGWIDSMKIEWLDSARIGA